MTDQLRTDEIKKIVEQTVDDHLRAVGILDKLNGLKSFIDATDAAFNLIERDPHQWSSRPCQTCSAISDLLGRPFGCVKRQSG